MWFWLLTLTQYFLWRWGKNVITNNIYGIPLGMIQWNIRDNVNAFCILEFFFYYRTNLELLSCHCVNMLIRTFYVFTFMLWCRVSGDTRYTKPTPVKFSDSHFIQRGGNIYWVMSVMMKAEGATGMIHLTMVTYCHPPQSPGRHNYCCHLVEYRYTTCSSDPSEKETIYIEESYNIPLIIKNINNEKLSNKKDE